jgi:hypothetical protein
MLEILPYDNFSFKIPYTSTHPKDQHHFYYMIWAIEKDQKVINELMNNRNKYIFKTREEYNNEQKKSKRNEYTTSTVNE